MPSAYFAAPLFTAAERAWNAEVARQLRAECPQYTWLIPQEFCAAHDNADGGPDYPAIFAACRDHLEQADVVIGVIDGPDPDSGTCWELGYAYAKDTPCYAIRTDWRPGEDGTANCMLTQSCQSVVTSVDALIAALNPFNF